MMDAIDRILQAPINIILVLAGLVLLFFSFFEVSKGTVRQRKGKTQPLPLLIGLILLLVGLILPTGETPPFGAMPDPASVDSETPTIPAPTVTLFPSITPLPTLTTAPTQTPSLTPEPTETPPPQTLNDGCIAASIWRVHPLDETLIDVSLAENESCLNLNTLGIYADTGGKVHLLGDATFRRLVSGISMPVGDQSIIEFKIFVNTMYIVYDEAPAFITFSIAPRDEPMAGRGSGRFKLHIEDPGNDALIYFMLADTTESTGTKYPTQHYLYRRIYTIRLELKGIFADVYINDARLTDRITIPAGEKVFYIGYDLPIQSGADIEVFDIKVDGETP